INQHAAMNTHLLHKVKTILEMISQPFPYFFILIFCIGLFLKNRIFYFMTLWIAIVLIPVYHIPKEWRLYLASVGFCIALSVNLYDLINRFSRNKKADLKNKFIFLIIFIVLFSYNNIVQINHQWKSVTDLSKNLYTKFKKEIPDIPDNSKIYIAGLDYADDVCSTALFDTVLKFMYEKNVSVQNFDNFFLDLKDNKSLNPEQIQLLEYKNERINIKDDWKKRLLDKRWGAGIRSQQDLILNIIDENIENLQKSNPQLSFMIKDNCCILFTNQSTLKILFKNKDLTSTYLNSVRIKMKVPKVYANFCDFFWETKEGKIGRTRFNAEKSDEIEEYKLPLGIRDDWFMTDSISGFGLHLPASSIELCQIEFSRELPLKQLSNKNQIHKNDSLQPIPAIRK
ncbi:hypothetical protein KKB18_01090, partial [bacterium]|nr:hypothetical protein [bacterium]